MTMPAAAAIYRPGTIPGVPEEVAACFPRAGVLHAYIWWASQTTHAPAWFHVGSGLVMLAAEASRRGYLIGQEQRQEPRVWAVLIGQSAGGKSTAVKRSQAFYQDYLRFCLGTEYRDPYITAEGSLPGIFEALAERFDPEANHSWAILVREEFTRLIDQRDHTIGDMLMEIADGTQVQRHLRQYQKAKREGHKILDTLKNPLIHGLFATTRSNLERAAKPHHMEGGLFSRFFWFNADPTRLMLHPSTCAAERETALAVWKDWARWLDAQTITDLDKIVSIPAEVHDILQGTLFADLERWMQQDDRLNPTRMRAITNAYTVAGLFALSCGRLVVTSEDMDAAVNLVETCTAGLEVLDQRLAVREGYRLARRVWEHVNRCGHVGVYRSRLYRALKITKADLDDALALLEDEGSVVQEPIPKRPGTAGRPGIRVRVVSDSAIAKAVAGEASAVVNIRKPGEAADGAD